MSEEKFENCCRITMGTDARVIRRLTGPFVNLPGVADVLIVPIYI